MGLYSPRMPHAEVTLPGSASSVPAARRFVETLLSSWGHPEAGWAAALCTSELASNCALHARTDFSVRLSLEVSAIRLEVSDGSRRVPAQRDYGAEATTGRGLRLLGEYASSWGVDMSGEGKTVWVLLDLDAATTGDPVVGDSINVEALLATFGDDDGDVRALSPWSGQVAA